MPQIDFYFCKEEKMRLANMVFDMGLKMIPDLSYDTENPVLINSISDYEPYALKNVLIFIVGSKLNHESLVFGSFEKNGKKSFFVKQRYGLASVDFYSPGVIEATEHRIGPGFLGNHPFYYNSDGSKLYPSEKDKNIFKELRQFIKKNSTPAKLVNRTFWIGKRCIALCRETGYNLVKIGDEDLLKQLNV
jgi:hypothetical protein